MVFGLFLFFNNSSHLTKVRQDDPFLLAHSGIPQTFSLVGIESDTCTAERIDDPNHPYLENTISSMSAAFDAGADMVELDIKLTKDNQFAVFHDWTLDCRTDATGMVSDYTMDELRKMDIGYGYTADEGKTHPFLGKGIGLMPSLDEVLNHFPDKQFLIHIKSDDSKEGDLLADFLSNFSSSRLSQLTVYGGDQPIASLSNRMPDLRVMSMNTLKSCLISYEGLGWTGYMPDACKNTEIHIPETYAPWIWGWPNKLLNRMDAVDTRVILVAGDGNWSEGFDSVNDLNRLPKDYSGGIWTNRIDLIAPELK